MSFLKPKALIVPKHILRENILKMQEHPVFFSVNVIDHGPHSDYPPRKELVLRIRWLKRDDHSVRLAIYNDEGGYVDWILHDKQMVLDYATPCLPRPASYQKRWCTRIAQGGIRVHHLF